MTDNNDYVNFVAFVLFAVVIIVIMSVFVWTHLKTFLFCSPFIYKYNLYMYVFVCVYVWLL